MYIHCCTCSAQIYVVDRYVFCKKHDMRNAYIRSTRERSGRVLGLRPRGCEFESHGVTALWSLSKTHLS